MAGTRADHYVWASDLVARARRLLAEEEKRVEAGPPDWDRANPSLTPPRWPAVRTDLPLALLAAAQVHATLAAAGPGVEQEVKDNERAVARALGAAEGDQGARQAARPPLRPARPVGELPTAVPDRTGFRRIRVTTCRCTGMPHDLGSPGCEQRGHPFTVEETAGTVRPKPGPPSRLTCHCSGVGHERGQAGCAHEVQR